MLNKHVYLNYGKLKLKGNYFMAKKSFFQTLAVFFASVFVLALAGCGGGSSSTPAAPPATYGSIAVNTTSAGISWTQSSQSTADSAAISACNSASTSGANCYTFLQYPGTGNCGAYARTPTRSAWGAASSYTLATAQANAITACQNVGLGACSVTLSHCN